MYLIGSAKVGSVSHLGDGSVSLTTTSTNTIKRYV